MLSEKNGTRYLNPLHHETVLHLNRNLNHPIRTLSSCQLLLKVPASVLFCWPVTSLQLYLRLLSWSVLFIVVDNSLEENTFQIIYTRCQRFDERVLKVYT